MGTHTKYNSDEERITNNIKINETTGCWEWQLYRDADGYGRIAVPAHGKETNWAAHRLSFVLFNNDMKPIPNGMLVMHQCDNRCCVNPDHLKLGTQKENMREAADRGRVGIRLGEKNNLAKLNARAVKKIKRRWVGKKVPLDEARQLADQYGVHHQTIRDIASGKTWTHISEVDEPTDESWRVW